MSKLKTIHDVVIIGGGAAGFFCAVNIAKIKPAVNITILEKHHKVLQKVKISGGGRCNLCNAETQISTLIKNYPRGKNFLKKTFSLFNTQNTRTWFEKEGVATICETDGRVFPASNQSQSIIDCLLRLVQQYSIQLALQTEVKYIQQEENTFKITTNKGELHATHVCVAIGGFSTVQHYSWIQKLGHTIVNPLPSLFTFNIPHKPLHQLMGLVAQNATIKIVGTKLSQQGPVLITHWGLSGPAILKLSAWGAEILSTMNYRFDIMINWLSIPEHELRLLWNDIRNKQGALTIGQKNPFNLSQRLWDFIIQESGVAHHVKWSECSSKDQNKLMHTLCSHTLSVNGKTTFKEEFVTCGGVDLAEINSLTMESKIIPRIYFAGEVLNVDGITGGFNFQHAWSSAYIAAQSIVSQL